MRYPGRDIAKPDTQLPHRSVQVVRPGSAKLGAFLSHQAAHLVYSLVVAAAEAVEPVADFRLQLKAVQFPLRVSHGQ